MVESQFVITPPAKAALFLVCTMAPGGEPAVRDLLQDVAGLRRSVSFRAPDAGLSCVVGIGSAAWDRLFEGPRPRDLHPFVALTGLGTEPRPPLVTCSSICEPTTWTSVSNWPS